LVRAVVTLGALLVMLALPVGSSAAVLYDQTDMATAQSISSQEFPDAPSATNQAADDFTVPPGQAWTIGEVDVSGIGLATAPINAYLYSGGGALPGAQIFAQPHIAATGGPSYAVPLSGAPPLPPGTYWVSIQAYAPTTASDDWSWTTRAAQAGNPAAWQNPGNGSMTGCVSWFTRSSCIGGDPDQVFKLLGTSSPYPPPESASAPSNAITLGKPLLNKRKGIAVEPVAVPGPGVLTLKGRGVVTQRPGRASISRVVSAAGIVNMLVKPRDKTKRKLNSTGSAKLAVTITYTPAGGVPNSKQKTIRLKKKLR
jgi:hypothetical protein